MRHRTIATLAVAAGFLAVCAASTADKQGGKAPPGWPTEGLAGLWTADGHAEDTAGGTSGSLQGGASYAGGIVGKAFALDGKRAAVSIRAAEKNLDFKGKDALSICAWVYVESAESRHPVFDTYRYGLEVKKEWGAYLWACHRESPWGGEGVGVPTPPLREWHHLVGVHEDSGSKISIYLDGRLANTGKGGEIAPVHLNPFIGYTAHVGGLYFQGRIDEVGVYNRALSAAEVQQVYRAGLLPWGRDAEPLTDDAASALQKDLGEAEPKAAAAAWRLARSPSKAVPRIRDALLRGLEPAAQDKDKAKKVERLVKQLDSDEFGEREDASEALALMGPSVIPLLEQSRREAKSPEVRSRLDDLLAALRPVPAAASPEDLRNERMIGILERIATPDAQNVLTEAAKRKPGTPLAGEAKAALERIAARQMLAAERKLPR